MYLPLELRVPERPERDGSALRREGLCASCAKGNHEVPPDGVRPTLDELIAAHESILTQLRQVREERKNVAHV